MKSNIEEKILCGVIALYKYEYIYTYILTRNIFMHTHTHSVSLLPNWNHNVLWFLFSLGLFHIFICTVFQGHQFYASETSTFCTPFPSIMFVFIDHLFFIFSDSNGFFETFFSRLLIQFSRTINAFLYHLNYGF